MCCTRLAVNTRRKNDAKNRHLRTIAELCRAISSQLRHMSTIRKKLVKQQYLLHMFVQYGELQPTSGWDRFVSLGHPCKFQLFVIKRCTNVHFPFTVYARIYPPFSQIDIIGAMVIVWRARGKIIRSVLCSIVCNNCTQWSARKYEQT